MSARASFVASRRAQSVGIALFFIALIGGAFVIWINQMAGESILNFAANQTSNPAGNAGTNWFRSFMNLLPVIFMGIGFFGLLAQAIFQREVG